jgi:taurine dioxygenase
MNIVPISNVLGARITGVDLAQTLDDTTFTQIESALHEHCFVVLPKQHLTPAQFVAFAQRFGPPEPHVIDTFHHSNDANILILSNVVRDGKPAGLADAGTYFHTDYSYLEVPARCTLLHALAVPAGENGTTFANQRRAYDELPQPTKDRIDGMIVRHHYGNRDDLDETSRTVASVLTPEQKKKVSWVHHRLARPHPHTGRRALYAVSGSSFGIEGMSDTEGVPLLDELKAHATQAKYQHRYDYAPGDVIVWDNAQLLHAAPLPDATEERTLWRITVKEMA